MKTQNTEHNRCYSQIRGMSKGHKGLRLILDGTALSPVHFGCAAEKEKSEKCEKCFNGKT